MTGVAVHHVGCEACVGHNFKEHLHSTVLPLPQLVGHIVGTKAQRGRVRGRYTAAARRWAAITEGESGSVTTHVSLPSM